MKTKYLFAILAILFLTTPVLATISIEKTSVTCSPANTNLSTTQCYKESKYYLHYTVTDDNATTLSAPAAWKAEINYGPIGNNLTGSTSMLSDSNIAKTTVCDVNSTVNDQNAFGEARTCTTILDKITNLQNGTYAFDLNIIATINGTWFNSDKNATIQFTIDNALVNSSNVSMLNMVPVVLAAIAILMVVVSIVAIKSGAVSILPMVAGLIGMLIALIVIAAFMLTVTGAA